MTRLCRFRRASAVIIDLDDLYLQPKCCTRPRIRYQLRWSSWVQTRIQYLFPIHNLIRSLSQTQSRAQAQTRTHARAQPAISPRVALYFKFTEGSGILFGRRLRVCAGKKVEPAASSGFLGLTFKTGEIVIPPKHVGSPF